MKRIVYFDYLRIIAIFAVVFLHATAPTLYNFNSDYHSWMVGNIFDSLVRWCVPVFIMVSGALLLNTNREEKLTTFFKKRAAKVVLPFIIWSLIYYFYRQMRNEDLLSIKDFTKDFLNNDVYFHLWFMYMILGLYLVTPIFRAFVQKSKAEIIRYFLMLWFLLSFLPIFNHFTSLDMPNYAKAVGQYVGFFVLGYYLNTYGVNKRLRYVLYGLSIFGFLFTIVGTYFATLINGGQFDSIFYDYYRPNVILEAVGVYLFFQQMAKHKHPQPHKWLIRLSNATFGVYLLHPIIRNFFFQYIDIQSYTFFTVWLVTVLTVIISFTVIIIIRRIPILGKVFS
jgi:surface polysaccharide O-acyltransferase-like enzyme